ncbi:MAG: hypothetical protein ACD_62C00075G0011 [uncultured bacterium]|nr:MAG: hypothetical protein ACD_62C00075G0011 [uncultured bacterium]HLD44415.1 hypothetical protein [bacterium]
MPSFIPKINRTLSLLLVACLILVGWSHFKTEKLPNPDEIQKPLYTAPLQTKTERAPFTQTYDGKTYHISPQYDYELTGLMVSYNDLDEAWFNIYYDNDPYNIKDVCVIWGSNLLKDYYQKVEYKSGSWTCYYRFRSQDVPYFNHEELSNSHLLPATTAISKTLKRARRGDQIHIEGYLINYSVDDREGQRKSSTTRQDKGQGACEVIYVTEFNILKSQNAGWRTLNHFAFGLGVLILVLKLYIFLAY